MLMLQTEFGKRRMIVRATPKWPMILALVFLKWQIVDAGDAPLHESELIKLPVFVALRAPPLSGAVMPFVGKAYGNAVAVICPQFLDEPIVQFVVPLSGQKLNDGCAARQELGAIAPHRIWRIGE